MKTLAISQPEFSLKYADRLIEGHGWISKLDWAKVAAWSVGMLFNLLGWYIVLKDLF